LTGSLTIVCGSDHTLAMLYVSHSLEPVLKIILFMIAILYQIKFGLQTQVKLILPLLTQVKLILPLLINAERVKSVSCFLAVVK